MKTERGDFVWDGETARWMPSETGRLVLHPVLGPMKHDDPLADSIIPRSLAEEIEKATKKLLKKYSRK